MTSWINTSTHVVTRGADAAAPLDAFTEGTTPALKRGFLGPF